MNYLYVYQHNYFHTLNIVHYRRHDFFKEILDNIFSYQLDYVNNNVL
jgi:hypothetical protein